MSAIAKRRVVAIVGRPNVGKSALFNRLVRRRVAIVHEQSGVTRDRLVSEAEWRGERYDVVDTGGLGNLDHRGRDEIEDGIELQVAAALEDAGIVVFVTDIEAGIVPLDQAVADQLRKSGLPIFLAANKADGPERDVLANEFSIFGFPVFPLSAIQGRGIDEMMEAIAPLLPPAENRSATNPLRVAIVGRPNVGKSSYINRLLNHDRVIVSSVPGTTRDSVNIPFAIGAGPQARHYLLTDTAGMRRKGKIDTLVERFSVMRAERAIASADVCVLVMDAVQGPTSHEKTIANIVERQGRGCVILVNKWDLAEEVTQREYHAALVKELPFLSHVPIVFASAKSGFNIRRTIDLIDHVGKQIHTELTTGVLNRVLKDACDRVQPPLVAGKRFKLYYAAQTGTAPVRVTMFVNSSTRITPNYHSYLVRCLREKFGLEGAPIVLQLRNRRSTDPPGAARERGRREPARRK